MKLKLGTFLILLLGVTYPVTAQAQDHTDLVIRIKNTLQAQGVDLSGACGAFQITKRVAWELRGEGYGLLGGKTPGQSGCSEHGDRYASDWVLRPNGQGADILSDAGGGNGPQWGTDSAEAGFYRPAFDPGDSPVPVPVPVPTPTPVPTPIPVPYPVPTPGPDYSSLLQQILQTQTEILVVTRDTNAHIASIDKSFGETMGEVGKFVGKYIAPAVGAFILAKNTGGQ